MHIHFERGEKMSNGHASLFYLGLIFSAFGVISGSYHNPTGIILTAIGLVMIIVAVWPVLKQIFHNIINWRNK